MEASASELLLDLSKKLSDGFNKIVGINLQPVVNVPTIYKDPWYMITVLVLYLYFVTKAGPQ